MYDNGCYGIQGGNFFFAFGISVKIKKILNKCNKNISSVNLSYFKLQGILFYLVLLVVFFQIFIEQTEILLGFGFVCEILFLHVDLKLLFCMGVFMNKLFRYL